MQPNIQLNQWSNQHNNLSKLSLNLEEFEHKDHQNTHTHTLNKSNQFYISKTKFRQFSEVSRGVEEAVEVGVEKLVADS